MEWRAKSFLRLSRSEFFLEEIKDENFEVLNRIQILGDCESTEIVREGKSQIIQFDHSFHEYSTNYEVYTEAIEPMVQKCVQGGVNGTVFCCKFVVWLRLGE
jgi:hypothetical protein